MWASLTGAESVRFQLRSWLQAVTHSRWSPSVAAPMKDIRANLWCALGVSRYKQYKRLVLITVILKSWNIDIVLI